MFNAGGGWQTIGAGTQLKYRVSPAWASYGFVEYDKLVADVLGAVPHDDWKSWVAPRHLGMCNILYVDGHVGTAMPDDIDPRVPSLQNQLWKPKSDTPLPE